MSTSRVYDRVGGSSLGRGSLAGAWGGGLGSYVGDIQVGGYCGEDRRQINCRGKTISDDERKYR